MSRRHSADERLRADNRGAADPGAGAPGDASRPAHAESHVAGAEPARSAPGAEASVLEDGGADGEVEQVEGDLDELISVAAQRDEYLALAQRTQADFENYRKRVARESAQAQDRGIQALARELLPSIDNLDRALEEAGARESDAGDEALLQGVRLVRSEIAAALARVGIESFSPLGEAFDPVLHEAMATIQPDGGETASGTVVEVYQPGYRLGEGIIRPARVVVAA